MAAPAKQTLLPAIREPKNGSDVRKGGITDIEIELLEGLPEEAGKLDLKLQFVALRAKGWSYIKIARRLKVSKGTLTNWSRELEEEIASLKAMELEALFESYFLLKEARVKLLGDQIKAIQRELKGRKLEDIPTETLLLLLLRYYSELREEYVEPRPLSSQEIAELRALREAD